MTTMHDAIQALVDEAGITEDRIRWGQLHPGSKNVQWRLLCRSDLSKREIATRAGALSAAEVFHSPAELAEPDTVQITLTSWLSGSDSGFPTMHQWVRYYASQVPDGYQPCAIYVGEHPLTRKLLAGAA
ncbi:hypothetical protein [Microbacterium sp. No. 7]|uniref:hypothetical protein n=1 Tax=Microbacterium sp. No. 7 TaxID=1714373 RepID=UPI0006D08992|nr:hypothetical protein [Microbacterium sp. No. 7]ALJ20363.1 hypothetical protein AOA12_10760 [Microbacterium sp. No. 7]